MTIWAFVNTILKIGHPPSTSSNQGFDPYPQILLNLFLSMLAGIQAAALLIAANRLTTLRRSSRSTRTRTPSRSRQGLSRTPI